MIETSDPVFWTYPDDVALEAARQRGMRIGRSSRLVLVGNRVNDSMTILSS
jgi:hypothetical protein